MIIVGKRREREKKEDAKRMNNGPWSRRSTLALISGAFFVALALTLLVEPYFEGCGIEVGAVCAIFFPAFTECVAGQLARHLDGCYSRIKCGGHILVKIRTISSLSCCRFVAGKNIF